MSIPCSMIAVLVSSMTSDSTMGFVWAGASWGFFWWRVISNVRELLDKALVTLESLGSESVLVISGPRGLPFRTHVRGGQLRASFVRHDYQVCTACRLWCLCLFFSRNRLGFMLHGPPLGLLWVFVTLGNRGQLFERWSASSAGANWPAVASPTVLVERRIDCRSLDWKGIIFWYYWCFG